MTEQQPDKRLDAILGMLESIASLDFSTRLTISNKADKIDAVASGLNMLSEELEANVVEKWKLEESEENLSATLNSIDDAVIATNTEANIVFMNPVAEKLTGWTKEDAERKHIKKVFHTVNEETGEEVESPVTRVLRGGHVVGLANHTILIAKDGTRTPIDDSGTAIKNKWKYDRCCAGFQGYQRTQKTSRRVAAEAETGCNWSGDFHR